ncbi:MAG TPA: aldose 1-epimerase [Vicinamibacterales bacterium]|nr:aldose 1-epimerase [Vicinamibacterales bacterium]
MKRFHVAWLVWLLCLSTVPATAQRYAAQRDGEVVHLTDTATGTRVSIAPSIGNIAFRMTVKGHDILRWPHADMAAFKANPNMTGIPFMAPWINRLDEQAFYANGKRYPFDMTLGNVRGAIPIHGFLTSTSEWRVVSVDAGRDSAAVTSRLEFFRQPAWMKQWPFAHSIDMTYRLSEGTLQVETTILNMSAEPMPVSIGFHPYFQLTDSPRDEWTISVGARTHWKLMPNKLPTGETEPIGQPFTGGVPLRDYDLDDDFSDLVRDAQGRATMTVIGKSQRIDVLFGPNYRTAVVWAPKPQNFICFEPMAAMTNALNLTQKGLYKELQSIPPGGTWRESFWIRPVGF